MQNFKKNMKEYSVIMTLNNDVQFCTFICMKGFFIKKAFFDGWDNLIGMVLLNIVYIAIFFLFVSSFALVEYGPLPFFLAILALLFVTAVFSGAVSNVAYGYSDYRRDTWNDLKAGFSRYFRHSMLMFLIYVVLALLTLFIIPFYMRNFGIIGAVISVILIWLVIFSVMALPYYFALSSYLPGDRPLKTLRKCFIIMGDNMGFSIFFLLYNIVCVALTLFTVGLIPGVAGMNLASHDAVRLLMMKYDYLEENPDADRKHLPWTDILFDEEEKVGPRSFKNMIFPWK